jgi:hypothetical protein
MSKKGRHTSAIQNELLLASLTKFFSKPSSLRVFLNIINGNSDVSLRLIDWFVTNYSKKKNVFIVKSKANGVSDHINVYLHYRSQLRAFSKHLFDPFRRQDKITFCYDKQNSVQTTIGQLNFFRWAIENEVLTYIQSNYDDIVSDMNTTQKEHSTPSASDKTKRVDRKKTRHELSKSLLNNMSLSQGARTIRFD